MGKRASIFWLSVSQALVLSLWFTASAAAVSIRESATLSALQEALLANAVQLGFVAGSLISALLALADRLEPRRLYAISALIGAAANVAVIFFEPGSAVWLGLRFVTGMIMAGVYPVGIKIAASWATRDRGLLVGILVGALAIGSALPHLIAAVSTLPWRWLFGASSLLAVIGAGVVMTISVGPQYAMAGAFRISDAFSGLRNRALRLANFGYFGHMWELYAFFVWIGSFAGAALAARGEMAAGNLPSLIAFAAIGSGAIGLAGGGWIADRIGRTAFTAIMLAVSGAMCLLSGLMFLAPFWLVVAGVIVWGIAASGDSAQFSTAISELSPPGRAGTMLTMQTAIGFGLTLVTIQLVPVFASWWGWQFALTPLALGPVFGLLSMLRLRALPEAVHMAHGRR
jgi:MFS family permease